MRERERGEAVRSWLPYFASWLNLGGRQLQQMIRDTLVKIEERIRAAESITPRQREELLGLLASLKSEVASLPEADRDQAQSIAGFTAVSAHEATRDERDPELVKLSVTGLSRSVEGFEETHPKLVQAVNSICTTLSNLGI